MNFTHEVKWYDEYAEKWEESFFCGESDAKKHEQYLIMSGMNYVTVIKL